MTHCKAHKASSQKRLIQTEVSRSAPRTAAALPAPGGASARASADAADASHSLPSLSLGQVASGVRWSSGAALAQGGGARCASNGVASGAGVVTAAAAGGRERPCARSAASSRHSARACAAPSAQGGFITGAQPGEVQSLHWLRSIYTHAYHCLQSLRRQHSGASPSSPSGAQASWRPGALETPWGWQAPAPEQRWAPQGRSLLCLHMHMDVAWNRSSDLQVTGLCDLENCVAYKWCGVGRGTYCPLQHTRVYQTFTQTPCFS